MVRRDENILLNHFKKNILIRKNIKTIAIEEVSIQLEIMEHEAKKHVPVRVMYVKLEEEMGIGDNIDISIDKDKNSINEIIDE
eukprot:snap_masked-scaffold_6-processed-gene-15.33-mRNA-1 protein AED:1.00 eAED:1.00 QI:0/-1/0/0/-1/1/1/0/82